MKNIYRTNKKNFTDHLIRAIFLIMTAYVLLFPENASQNVHEGCVLFYENILPGLLPFFVLSSFAVNSGIDRSLAKTFGMVPKILSVSSGEYAYTISVLSGYPTSAKVISEGYLSGKISKRDAQILLILCSNGSAAFILSFIGGALLKNSSAALVIMAANYLSPIVTSYLFSKSCPENGTWAKTAETSHKIGYIPAFVGSVKDSLGAIMNVGAFIVIFSVIGGMCREIFGKSLPAKLLLSLLELSSGCRDIAGSDLPLTLKISLMGFMVCFGGVCVMFQNLSFIEKTDLDKNSFFRYKLLNGAVGFIITYIFSALFTVSDISVFYPMDGNMEFSYTELNILLLMLAVTIILYNIISIKADNENENNRNFETGSKGA